MRAAGVRGLLVYCADYKVQPIRLDWQSAERPEAR
jgi:hypothetical protein